MGELAGLGWSTAPATQAVWQLLAARGEPVRHLAGCKHVFFVGGMEGPREAICMTLLV